jgi:hypothetical protein
MMPPEAGTALLLPRSRPHDGVACGRCGWGGARLAAGLIAYGATVIGSNEMEPWR